MFKVKIKQTLVEERQEETLMKRTLKIMNTAK